MVTSHVIALGHRDIAFLFPDIETNDRARDRRTGALSAARSAGIAIAPERIIQCLYDIGEAKTLALSFLSNNPPTAVVCCNDIIAHGVIYACQAMGVNVPGDLSVIGIGDFRGSAHMEPALTTIRLPARRIGAMAADATVAMSMDGQPPDPLHKVVEFSFLERGSTGPPRCRG